MQIKASLPQRIECDLSEQVKFLQKILSGESNAAYMDLVWGEIDYSSVPADDVESVTLVSKGKVWTDAVPAMLSPGSYYFPSKMNHNILERINRGQSLGECLHGDGFRVDFNLKRCNTCNKVL